MSAESTATAMAWVALVISVLWIIALWRTTKRRSAQARGATLKIGVALVSCGLALAAGVSLYWLSEHAYPSSSTCGDAPGTVSTTAPLESYGFGLHRRLIVINLTSIGSAGNIHDDDKEHATMATYVNNTLQKHYNIGIEIKGTKAGGKWSYGIETQEWDDDDNEWDGHDTEISEFGFTREYEDYVIRSQVNSDPSFVTERSNFIAQPSYYQHTMLELVFAVGDALTYEGVYHFVNNPAKKDSIPNAIKLKDPVNATTYIVEYEYNANKPCNLAGHPHLECKYPKTSKMADNSEATEWLKAMLAFDDRTKFNWTSLAFNFLGHQFYLVGDMGDRSMTYHFHNGLWHGGPLWDVETANVPISCTPTVAPTTCTEGNRADEWVVFDDPWHFDWWPRWLKSYPEFSQAIANSTAVEVYAAAFAEAEAYIKQRYEAGDFTRETSRYPCNDILLSLTSESKWHTARTKWMKANVATFTEGKVTYVTLLWRLLENILIAAVVLICVGGSIVVFKEWRRANAQTMVHYFDDNRDESLEMPPLRF